MRIRFNDGWQFSLGEANRFNPVALPHDWLIGDPNNWYKSGVGWYQRTLDAGFLKPGLKVYLQFDGVYMNSTLYVNQKKAGEWKNGFTSFEHDITDYLTPDADNVILLKVDARFPSVRWYSGAGIYRDVSLVVKVASHFVKDGVYITTYQDDMGAWQYEVTAEYEADSENVSLRHEVLEQGPFLPWSPEEPRLYTLRSTLLVDGEQKDVTDTRFGFRSLRFDPKDGFFLNGVKRKLNGVCLHQEFSIIGAATHRDFIKRQMTALMRMGVNAVRTAHNAPSSLFMRVCEEMGMLVLSEFSDVWQLGKTENDYSRYFDAWHERDIASWIRRDRNSPSVIMWSLGNEIPDTNADTEKGGALLLRLYELVKSHDPRGQALPTLGSNYMAWENTQKAVAPLTAVGYNYAEFLYQKHHERYPDKVIYGSETCSTVQSRGVYHFPLSIPTLADDDLQTSSLGNSTTSWGTLSVDKCIKDDRDTPFSIGQFVWSGQDYLGEPTPYQTKNSYFGMLDTAGFEKDAFYLFQSAWTDRETRPMVHLFPYWDFSKGQMIDVRVCSNQPHVKLFLNDALIGEADMEGEITRNWRIPYQASVLKAQAYDEAGQLKATAEQSSFGEAVQLKLTCEHYDKLSFVHIQALDESGLPVENANALVEVQAEGGVLLGLDNGDASDYTPYQASSRRLFSGKLLAVVKRIPGMELNVKAEISREYIPVRKIELSKTGNHVRATTYPRDAAPQPLFFRLTTAAGVDSRLSSFVMDEDGQGIMLTPLYDGEVYVRCGVKNDKPHLDFYTQISFENTGAGKALLNPYQEISGSLYAFSDVALENGYERGIATPRNTRSLVCFENLDFGEKGSDNLSLWLFPMDSEPFDLEIWEGKPDEGGRLLARPRYDLGSEWIVYKEFKVNLAEKLKGITTVCFVFERKLHLRGFFASQARNAFECVKAADRDELYGDSYRIEGNGIADIGNNTTIGFTDLSLPPPGASRIEITYTSDNPDNPVQVQINREEGQIRSMLNLGMNREGQPVVFDMGQRVSGLFNLRLIFLPGCKLSLEAFRFPAD